MLAIRLPSDIEERLERLAGHRAHQAYYAAASARSDSGTPVQKRSTC